MFGLYRTILALMVVLLHVGGIPTLGNYAVFGFYMLSGYLMTLIMQGTYGYSARGVIKYLQNRFLRIYPLYWISLLASLTLIFLLGEDYVAAYNHYMRYLETWQDIIKNVFLIFPTTDTLKLTPPSWALTVEIFFYVLIALGISKCAKYTLWWLSVSIIYHVVALVMNWDRYFSVFAASLPFALGASLYFFRRKFLQLFFGTEECLHVYLPILVLFLMFTNWYVGFLLDAEWLGIFFYINMFLSVIMILVLSSYKALPFLSKKTDQRWGDFSYPIYLLHTQVALVVLFLLRRQGLDISSPDIVLMWVTIPFVFVAAWLLMVLVERPIERLRKRVKEKL